MNSLIDLCCCWRLLFSPLFVCCACCSPCQHRCSKYAVTTNIGVVIVVNFAPLLLISPVTCLGVSILFERNLKWPSLSITPGQVLKVILRIRGIANTGQIVIFNKFPKCLWTLLLFMLLQETIVFTPVCLSCLLFSLTPPLSQQYTLSDPKLRNYRSCLDKASWKSMKKFSLCRSGNLWVAPTAQIDHDRNICVKFDLIPVYTCRDLIRTKSHVHFWNVSYVWGQRVKEKGCS